MLLMLLSEGLLLPTTAEQDEHGKCQEGDGYSRDEKEEDHLSSESIGEAISRIIT